MKNTTLNQVINQVLANYTFTNPSNNTIQVAKLTHYSHYYNQDGDPIEIASIEHNITQDVNLNVELGEILTNSIQSEIIEALTQYMAQDSNAGDITTTEIPGCASTPTIITNQSTGHIITICCSDSGLHITSFKVLS